MLLTLRLMEGSKNNKGLVVFLDVHFRSTITLAFFESALR